MRKTEKGTIYLSAPPPPECSAPAADLRPIFGHLVDCAPSYELPVVRKRPVEVPEYQRSMSLMIEKMRRYCDESESEKSISSEGGEGKRREATGKCGALWGSIAKKSGTTKDAQTHCCAVTSASLARLALWPAPPPPPPPRPGSPPLLLLSACAPGDWDPGLPRGVHCEQMFHDERRAEGVRAVCDPCGGEAGAGEGGGRGGGWDSSRRGLIIWFEEAAAAASCAVRFFLLPVAEPH